MSRLRSTRPTVPRPTFVVFWNGHFYRATEDRAQADRMAQHLRDMGAARVTVGTFTCTRTEG